MKRQPFYAVRVVVRQADGSTATRDYVRGETRMSVDRFSQWALGNLLSLVSTGDAPITWAVHSIEPATVHENRRYHHTTHTEGA